jgi:dienelactone hydrolase
MVRPRAHRERQELPVDDIVIDPGAAESGHAADGDHDRRGGFGVLMIEARGHGDSAGRAMDFGSRGDADIAAAGGDLADCPDVDRQRIGVVGMSMGGEEALGATATDDLIRNVIAEGATARNAADAAWLSDQFGVRGLVQQHLERLQDVATDALTSASVPTSMCEAVEASGETRHLLITAGTVADEGRAAAYVAAGAPERVHIWTVPDAAHTDGLQTDTPKWEARVIAFLTDSLGTGSETRREHHSIPNTWRLLTSPTVGGAAPLAHPHQRETRVVGFLDDDVDLSESGSSP